MTFYDNYVRLCNARGVSPTSMAKEIGLEKSSVSRWARGSVPRYSTLTKVADYFGISVGELVGVTAETAQNLAHYYGVSVDLLLGNANAAAPEDIETKKPATEVTGNVDVIRDEIMPRIAKLSQKDMIRLMGELAARIQMGDNRNSDEEK